MARLPTYLRTHRKRNCLTQGDVARLVGARSRATVARWERVARRPSLETALALQAILGLAPRELFPGIYQAVDDRVRRRAAELLQAPGPRDGTPRAERRAAALQAIAAGGSARDHLHGGQRNVLVLCVAPIARGFGYAVFEGPADLVDWGVTRAGGDVNAAIVRRTDELLAALAPDALILRENSDPALRRSRRLTRLPEALARVAACRKVPITTVTRAQIRALFAARGSETRHAIARAVAEQHPELAPWLPPPRRLWMSQDARIGIFDAAAAGHAFFGWYDRRRLQGD